MGVEFYTCNYCGETFSDCGGFVGCECGTKWCDDECAEADGYISEHCNLHPDLDDYDLMYDYRKNHCDYDSCYKCEHYVKASCKYCRQEDFDDGVLLEYALNLLNMSREEVINGYKKSSKENNKQ